MKTFSLSFLMPTSIIMQNSGEGACQNPPKNWNWEAGPLSYFHTLVVFIPTPPPHVLANDFIPILLYCTKPKKY